MDREKLKSDLAIFFKKCKEIGKPIDEFAIVEAFPGNIATSYVLKIRAEWANNMSCYEALEILFDILWDSSPIDIRKNIFCILIVDKHEDLINDNYSIGNLNGVNTHKQYVSGNYEFNNSLAFA